MISSAIGTVIAIIIAIAAALGGIFGIANSVNDNKTPAPAPVTATASPTPTTEKPAATELTRDQAIDIALKHAGLTRDQVIIDERDTKIDYERGIKVWDVEFDLKSNPRADDDYEYEINATTGDILKAEKPRGTQERPTTQPAAPTTATPATAEITRDQAIDIALKHAGLTRDQVIIDERDTKIDRERGIKVWDVEFDLKSNPRADDDYEYEINATTGDILKAEKPRGTQERPTTQPTATTELTRDEAIDIALKHAGLTRDQVIIDERDTHIDYDDGRKEWQVEFRSGAYEYDYEIDAATGQILESDKDYDHD